MGSAGDVSTLSMANNNHGKLGDSNQLTLMANGSARKMASSIASLDIQRDPTYGSRRLSMASHLSDSRGLYPKGQLPVDFMPAYRMGYPLSWDPLYIQSPIQDSGSEFNASLYPPPQRLLYPGYALGPSMPYGLPRYPFHSSCAQSYDFYDMGAMSRSLLDPEIESNEFEYKIFGFQNQK
ncbi:hypothetical protein Anas_05751 [Armadillidium nasatum]|uniref:Uncharacterized protein n=1 Tax=Armadillidium nasatum TaxID=96803 RepID=A0A5N5SXQ0_9CRUS|nr:hypothetical protein Anas_05751 [Armadillidium nasatum]